MRIKYVIFFLCLMVAVITGWNSGIAEAKISGSCGTGTECYSVPDGCGEGVGCVRTDCDSFSCPEPDWDAEDEYCFYCEDSDPGEG